MGEENPGSSRILPGVKKIAILRANAIGDFVFTLPALKAIQETYTQAEIVLIGKQWHASFLSGRPSPVDRVIPVPGMMGLERPAENQTEREILSQFFESLQQESFDIAFQLYGGGRYSNPYIKRFGAKLTAGLKSTDAEALDLWIPYIYWQPEFLRCLEVAALAGARTADIQPRIPVIERDIRESLEFLPDREEPIVLFHLGSGDPRRRWPAEKFARLGDLLSARGALVVVLGTEVEREPAQSVLEKMQSRAVDACGKTSMEALLGLIKRSSLVVSNDSGPLHLAIAAGAATVGIYWGPNIVTAGPAERMNHRPHLSWMLTCPTCGRDAIQNLCDHTDSLVSEVKVEEVFQSAVELLSIGDPRSLPLSEAIRRLQYPSSSVTGADAVPPLSRLRCSEPGSTGNAR